MLIKGNAEAVKKYREKKAAARAKVAAAVKAADAKKAKANSA